MDLQAFYDNIGEDYELIFRRLLSAERIEKYLSIFFNDNNMDDLKTQIFGNDMQSALNTSHSLKGVTATLGFEHFADNISTLHGLLKNNETDKAKDVCQQILKEYEIIYNVYRSFK